MASQSQSHDDALWAKLHELELQLAAYKLLRAARGEDAGCADGAGTPGGSSTCRGRQYDAYMRRRDARRVAATAEQHHHHHHQQQQQGKAQQPRATRAAAGRATPMSPRAARWAARDAHEATATPRLVGATQAKRTPAVPSVLPAPSTPRRELPRSRTVSGGAATAGGSPARPPSHHQRRSSLGAAAELGECATPRPFLKRGTGTGGAAAPARARARVHDLPAIDVAAVTPRPLLLPAQELAHAPRHARSVSELPLETAALASPQAARPRKRWGSPERPAAMYSAAAPADSYGRDLSKGLRKLLSFVRKGGRSGGGGGDQAALPAPSPRVGGKPVSVSKGWSGCSLVDVPLDRGASLDGHRFPMTRAVGISG